MFFPLLQLSFDIDLVSGRFVVVEQKAVDAKKAFRHVVYLTELFAEECEVDVKSCWRSKVVS